MNEAQILEIGNEAILVLLKVALPILLIALVVGLLIAFFQALTQIQEVTLTFVPKIVAIFLAIILLLPYIGGQLGQFSGTLYQLIIRSAT